MTFIKKTSMIHTREQFHAALQESLSLPDYYGRNLDALWDCLTRWIDVPLTLIWKDYETSRKHLGEYAERALELFKQAESEVDGFKIEVH